MMPSDKNKPSSTRPTANPPVHAQASSFDSPASWVDEHADALFRYAMPRVRDRSTAEDIVQETFLAAVESRTTFQGGSQRRTWLIGILRHKISDHFRRNTREVQAPIDDDSDDVVDNLFDEKGRWRKPPKNWDVNPAEIAERAEFWIVMRGCIDALPERAGEAFSLRMIDDAEPDEVCKVLEISQTNLWVLLHRARTRLRECLDVHWFNRPPKDGQ